MPANKKPRKKSYRPKTVWKVPPILFQQEPDAKFVAMLDEEVRTAFISLLMQSGDEKSFRIVLRHLLLGTLLVEKFLDSQSLREHLQMQAEKTIDALVKFKSDGTYDREAVSAVESDARVVSEIVSKAPAADVGMVMNYLAKKADETIDKLIAARERDLEELRRSLSAASADTA